MVTTYCQASDIASFLRVTISGSTNPTTTQVESIINRQEDIIDRRTGHAWRSTIITEEEHDLGLIYTYGWGTPIFLHHRRILDISAGSGDKIELWNGDSYQDVTSDTTNYKLDKVRGKLYVRGVLFTIMRKGRIRITYRYGDTVVPGDIKDACIKLTSIDLLASSFKMDIIPGGGQIKYHESMDRWKFDAETHIKNREEVYVI